MRSRYVDFLNRFPLVAEIVIFATVFFLLVPVAGEYAGLIALVAAAKLTDYW